MVRPFVRVNLGDVEYTEAQGPAAAVHACPTCRDTGLAPAGDGWQCPCACIRGRNAIPAPPEPAPDAHLEYDFEDTTVPADDPDTGDW